MINVIMSFPIDAVCSYLIERGYEIREINTFITHAEYHNRIVETKCKRLIAYKVGQAPDSGVLASEWSFISTYSVENVFNKLVKESILQL